MLGCSGNSVSATANQAAESVFRGSNAETELWRSIKCENTVYLQCGESHDQQQEIKDRFYALIICYSVDGHLSQFSDASVMK